MTPMTPDHPQWHEFLELVGTALMPELDANDNIVSWRRSGTFELARGTCKSLGLTDEEIDASEEWWRDHSAYNDEEIMLNLTIEDEDA